MLDSVYQAHFQGPQFSGSRELLKIFYFFVYEHDSNLVHVTKTVWINFDSAVADLLPTQE